jgi:hypothetical protein
LILVVLVLIGHERLARRWRALSGRLLRRGPAPSTSALP